MRPTLPEPYKLWMTTPPPAISAPARPSSRPQPSRMGKGQILFPALSNKAGSCSETRVLAETVLGSRPNSRAASARPFLPASSCYFSMVFSSPRICSSPAPVPSQAPRSLDSVRLAPCRNLSRNLQFPATGP